MVADITIVIVNIFIVVYAGRYFTDIVSIQSKKDLLEALANTMFYSYQPMGGINFLCYHYCPKVILLQAFCHYSFMLG